MKKLLLLVALCFCASMVSAQMIEIVHLKNGGRIRGIITEQIPNKQLKIQTADGSVFVYTFDEIEKITKELPGHEPASAFGNRRNNAYTSSFLPHYEGGVDLGYSIGVSSIDRTGRLNVSTTHGCRLIPELYVGAGLGVDYYHDGVLLYNHKVYKKFGKYVKYGIPIFADFRGYFIRQTVKPFLNFRIGYSVGDVEGLYFSPSIGVNYKMLNVSLGYTYQKVDDIINSYYDYDHDYYDDLDEYDIRKANIGAVTIKVGVRF